MEVSVESGLIMKQECNGLFDEIPTSAHRHDGWCGEGRDRNIEKSIVVFPLVILCWYAIMIRSYRPFLEPVKTNAVQAALGKTPVQPLCEIVFCLNIKVICEW